MTPDDHQEETDGRRLRGAHRRAQLVDAAVRVIARDGVAGVTHRAVAAEAEVPKSAATYHFTSLDDLLVAALRHDTEQLVAALPSPPDGSDIGWLAEELVTFIEQHREQVLAGYELYLFAARRPALRPAVDLWLDVVGSLVRHHTDDAMRVRTCVAAIDGYTLQCLTTGVEPSATELAALLRIALH